jgi:Na+-transporting NADH:ubiquinone oxidoreductase subunit A
MSVKEGDVVKRGQKLFEDRNNDGVFHTSPAAGTVVAIHRGERRMLQSIVIELSEGERAGEPRYDEYESFESFRSGDPGSLGAEAVEALLVESGMWTAIRARPFGKSPPLGSRPAAIFVTASDSDPLSADPDVVLADQMADFDRGLRVLAQLTEGPTYLCVGEGSKIPDGVSAPVTTEVFAGPHPSGTAGVHIHTLAPVSRARTVWQVGYQDVASIGRLFETGRLDVRRTVAIGGPPVTNPRLIATRVGASVAEIAKAEGLGDGLRWISGSVFSGKACVDEPYQYLGRFDNQISVLAEGGQRDFLGMMSPGFNKFSILPAFASALTGGRSAEFTTATHGSHRAMVPIGMYEKVFPFDMEPVFLLRSLAVSDVEQAEEMGALELLEEDVALCTFVCPGKENYGPLLRNNLEIIQKEG